MVHWPATLYTVVTLLAGGGLAMAGQALADRRARRREREARRETFMMQNFTAQREALTKIQEMVEEFGNKQNDESIGKTGKRYFAYFASPEYREAFPDVDPIEDFIAGDLSELTRFAEQFNVFKTRYNRDLRLSADGANKQVHFLREFSTFETALTIQANRTGSQFIVTEVRSYIGAAHGYGDERDDAVITEPVARHRLQAAVTKALTEGPLAA